MKRTLFRYIFAVTALFSAALVVSCDEDTSPVSPGNSPPGAPHLPSPEDSSTYSSDNLVVSWECSDPDGDVLLYSVEVLENGDYQVFKGETTEKTMNTGLFLLRETEYTWRVVAYDGLENNEGDWWTFFTPEWSNDPPYQPADPSPEDGATGIQVTGLHLSWSADDPDENDPLTFAVFFGTGNDPELVAAGLTETSYALPALDHGTEYYWYIVSTDSRDESTRGPLWTFTTMEQPGGLLARIGRFFGLTGKPEE
jgi:hypothetical protein